MQVLGFMYRGAGLRAALFAAPFISRTAVDWLVPAVDFHTRSIVSTWLGAGILLLAGFAAAWRSGSIVAGSVLGLATRRSAIIGAATLLAVWERSRKLLITK
jgi:hypothetical protein